MLRKSVAILSVFLSFITADAVALGLGRVSVESSLNQPLTVRIEILQLGDTRLEDVNIQVASPEDFLRFNIERAAFLNNIRFDTDAGPQGNFVILTTNQIVREPYLSFILDTRWTNGRLLSEHTILLDLPVYEDEVRTETQVRRPISAVLPPRSAPQIAEPAVVAPTSSAPSVQPIIQPEVIAAPNAGDTPTEDPSVEDPSVEEASTEDPSVEETSTESPSVEETSTADAAALDASNQAANSSDDAAIALTQNTAAETDPQSAEEEPVVESADDSEPSAELEEAPEDIIDNDSEELVAESEITDESANDDLVDASGDTVSEEPVEAEQADEVAPAPETLMTGPSDTLSDIALRVRPDNSVSIQQTMLAIQELNPDAFTGGNINRLRSGEVLRVPSITEIQAIGQREAVAEVSRQNQQVTTDVQPLAAPSNAVPAQDEEASGQLSVITSDIDADSAGGAGVMEDADDTVLDGRISELENQLALRAEDADRARIEKEELESRLAELDEQIAAAQEIIRLRDLQLAQLQQSLADAAAEAERQAQELQSAATISAEIAETQPSGLVDSLLRTLMGNSIAFIAAVVAVILLLAGFLVMRNKTKQPDEEELDTIKEDEFKGVTDAKDVTEDNDGSDAAMGAEFHDYREAELDSELDDIISIGGQSQRDSEIFADPVLNADQDIGSEVDLLVENDQLEQADLLLAQALRQSPGDSQLLLKRLEVIAARGDLSAFEMQAETLQKENDPAINGKIDSLRKDLAVNTIVEPQGQDSFDNEAETRREKAETASFLDDLGIDLDSFEDDAFHIADDSIEETQTSKPLDVSLDDITEETEPDAIDLMFDLGAEPEPDISESAAEKPDEEEKSAAANEVDFDLGEAGKAAQPELIAEPIDDEVDIETLEFDHPVESDFSGGDSKDPEDLEIDTLEFEIADPAEEEPAVIEEELDLETFSFDSAPESVPNDEPVNDVEDDDNVLDFNFDSADAKAEPEAIADHDAFDFDLDDDSTATASEKSEASEESEDEISLDFGDANGSGNAAPANDPAAIEDDFDFDLNELEIDADDIDADDIDVSDVGIGLTDDDFLDLDLDLDSEADSDVGSDESLAKPSVSLDSAADDETFSLDDKFDEPQAKADPVADSPAAAGDDLEFLSEDDIAFEATDFEGDPESLSDEDETATKLELAYAYQKMGDAEGAQEILREVIAEGTEAQTKEARELMETLKSSSD
ncbi:MAG: pilus assembly protein FimV [Pseudohongiellaceae bacterium]|jgi:pilus assembly protein FimV